MLKDTSLLILSKEKILSLADFIVLNFNLFVGYLASLIIDNGRDNNKFAALIFRATEQSKKNKKLSSENIIVDYLQN